MGKVSASVIAYFSPDSKVTPLKILTGDGYKMKVDRVLDIRPAASLLAGGSGTRYVCECTVLGEDGEVPADRVYLFRDDDSWYTESRSP